MTDRRSVICAIRGPLMMIALGVLAMVDHMGGPSFWRTWPVLLILLGMLKLAERMGVKSV